MSILCDDGVLWELLLQLTIVISVHLNPIEVKIFDPLGRPDQPFSLRVSRFFILNKTRFPADFADFADSF